MLIHVVLHLLRHQYCEINIFQLILMNKLQENTNYSYSITKILTNEMNDELNSDNNVNERKKDDWSIDVNVISNYNFNLGVPSFVRLFVIRRIIVKYINYTNNKQRSTESLMKKLAKSFTNSKNKNPTPNETFIKQLVTVFNGNDSDSVKIKKLATFILTRLINDGIKMYMKKWYNEREQSNVIEEIFNKIILKQFAKEYNELITYKTNNNAYDINENDYFYQDLVFSSIDLMPEIFQYLEWGEDFKQDLLQCSLVNSDWFYHVWNVNSVYKLDLEPLVEQTLKCQHNEDSTVTRLWQRLIHAKSLRLLRASTDVIEKSSPLLVNKLCMLRKIEKVHISIKPNMMDLNMLKTIMSKCSKRITYCRIWITPFDKENELSPLKLANARKIEIDDLYFYRIWTNKCRELNLTCRKSVSKDWCEFVIKNCDCSSVRNLILCGIKFDNQSINESTLKQLASKFVNLRQLKIEFSWAVDENVLIFWQLLHSIVLKNNVKVELNVFSLDSESLSQLNKMIENRDVKISKLTLTLWCSSTDIMDWVKQRDSCDLNHLVIGSRMIFNEMMKLFKQVSLKSISIVEIDGTDNWSDLNDFLGLNVIVENELFVIVNIRENLSFGGYGDDKFSPLFDLFCKNIIKLLAQQIPFDIKIKLSGYKQLYNSCLLIYSPYFENNQFLSKYNKPKCNVNHSCLPRVQPLVYLSDNVDYVLMRATNVQYWGN